MPVAVESLGRQLRRRHILEHRQHVVDGERRDVFAEQQARRVLGARHLIGAVHERRHLAREHALRLALLRRGCVVAASSASIASRSRNVKNFR